jgi:DnaK suppressor protein
MIRRNALSRLHKNLLACNVRLGKKLAGDRANLRDFGAADATGDSADLAFEADGDEMSSRLAELDTREQSQIERALARWQQGSFGFCESCQKPISLARLNALPHTPFCIRCEREMENHPAALVRQSKGHWSQISDAQAPMQDQKVDLAEMEMQVSGERRS